MEIFSKIQVIKKRKVTLKGGTKNLESIAAIALIIFHLEKFFQNRFFRRQNKKEKLEKKEMKEVV